MSRRSVEEISCVGSSRRESVERHNSAALAVAVSSAAGAQTIVVTMDQAKLARVPPRTATLVVGNPLIADVSVQAGGAMVITGKSYGLTNLIALDSSGR